MFNAHNVNIEFPTPGVGNSIALFGHLCDMNVLALFGFERYSIKRIARLLGGADNECLVQCCVLSIA